jgi:ataxia telangiectasia mutated family protein
MLKTPERVRLPHYTLMFWTYTLPLQAVPSIWNNAGGLNCTVLWEEFFTIEICCAFQCCTYIHHVCQVPFRLTREIIDGMGVSGVEGIFRRCCEATLSVMRTNKEALLTIIEASSSVTKQDNFCNLSRNNSSSLCAAWGFRADVIVCYIFTGLHLWSFVQMGALTSQGLGTTAGVFKNSAISFSMDSSL